VDDKLIKTIDLKNGLHLEVLDCSRKIAGDRWQVVMTVSMNIPLKMLGPVNGDRPDLNVNEVISLIGKNVRFEQKKERNFVDENRKEDVFNDLIDSFFHNSIDYISNPDFPKRYILRQYKEHLKKRSWYPESQDDE
jgi:hypothetical protein